MNAQETKLPQPMLPRGLAGRIIAWMMPLGHNSIYKRVSKVLNLQPEDDLAEVDCGGGYFVKNTHLMSGVLLALTSLMSRSK